MHVRLRVGTHWSFACFTREYFFFSVRSLHPKWSTCVLCECDCFIGQNSKREDTIRRETFIFICNVTADIRFQRRKFDKTLVFPLENRFLACTRRWISKNFQSEMTIKIAIYSRQRDGRSEATYSEIRFGAKQHSEIILRMSEI